MGKAETVLIVDDNDLVRKLVCAQVASGGYRVVEADSPKAALALSRCCGRLDIVVADLLMPDGGGVALVQALRQQHQALRALFMSGLEEAHVPGSFIAKPFSGIELLDALRRLLEDADLPVAIGA
jgi:CheY-like chemotaxis protein